jgi:hypothetical protein
MSASSTPRPLGLPVWAAEIAAGGGAAGATAAVVVADVDAGEAEAAEVVRRNTPNYPPFPAWFCVKPFVFHDTSVDLAPSWQIMQRACFIHFHVYIGILFLNIIACGVQLNIPHTIAGKQGPTVSFIVSIVYFLFFPFIKFYTQYWMLYKAIRDASGLKMVLAMFMNLVFAGYNAWMASGFYNSGGAGFTGGSDMGMANTVDSYKAYSAILYVMGILWTLDVVFLVFVLVKSFIFWKTGGLKFSDYREDAIKGAANNKTIQKGVWSAASAGGSAAVSGAGAAARSQF